VPRDTETLLSTLPLFPIMDLKEHIRTVPDFPKKGIMFRDITTLIKHPEAFDHAINEMHGKVKGKVDAVAGIESRGFIFGAPLALKLGVPFIPLRKPGKLPSLSISQEYALEYGQDKIEMHVDAVKEGDHVLIVDDLIATGGTAKAACQLVEKAGAEVAGLVFLVELPALKGREKLEGYEVHALVEFEGD